MASVATERVVVLMAPQDKAKLEDKARRAGTSVGEFVRRSIDAYEPEAGVDELECLLVVLEQSSHQALAALAEAERELATTEAYFAAKRVRDGHH
jgi:hypothetical protein